MRVAFRLFLMVCVLLLTGCSGDLGAPTGLLTRAVTFSVQWGSLSGKSAHRSKADPVAIIAPSQARSAVLTLLAASADNSDFSMTVNRSLDTTDQTFTQTYPVNTPLRVGATVLVVTCFVDANAQGDQIGSLVNPKITVNSAPTVIPVSTVQTTASVSLLPNQTITVGSQLTVGKPASASDKQLQFTPLDASGNGVIVSPGDVTVNIVSGQENLQEVGNTLIGFTAGKPTISVTINGVTSAPVAISVVSKVRVAISPTQQSVNVKVGQQQFAATVTSVDGSPAPNTKVYWSVLEGTSGGTIDANGLYTAPAAQGVFHVIATSQADPGQSATATVNVVGGDGNVTIQ